MTIECENPDCHSSEDICWEEGACLCLCGDCRDEARTQQEQFEREEK